MIKNSIKYLLIAGLFCGAAASAHAIEIADRFYDSAISSNVPMEYRSDVTAAYKSAQPDVTVEEMADMADAGFKSSVNRLTDAVAFVDAILAAQAEYDKKAQECITKLGGTMSGDDCVGRDGYKLVYGEVCLGGANCITEYSTVVTNMTFVFNTYINTWISRNNIMLTCLPTFRVIGGFHYLQCSAGGLAYEFQFKKLDANDEELRQYMLDNMDGVDLTDEDIDVSADIVAFDEWLATQLEKPIVVKPLPIGTACPAKGNFPSTINDQTKVGDACSTDTVATGSVVMNTDDFCVCQATSCKQGQPVTLGICCPLDKPWDAKEMKCATLKGDDDEKEPEEKITPNPAPAANASELTGLDILSFYPYGTACPATGNQTPAITDKHRVGDECSSSTIAVGEIVMVAGNVCACNATKCKDTWVLPTKGVCCPANMPWNADKNMCVAPEKKKFYHVCGEDKGKTGRQEICVDNYFTNPILGGVNVGLNQARALAKEYIIKVHNDTSVECDTQSYPCGNNDDCIMCSSEVSKRYYEIVFDDAEETNDAKIANGVGRALCYLHNLDYEPNGRTAPSTNAAGMIVSEGRSWPASCVTTNPDKCAMVNQSAMRMEWNATIGQAKNGKACVFNQNNVYNESDLVSVYGLNSMAFQHIQLNANANLDSQVEQYVRNAIAPTPLTSFECSQNYRTFYRNGKREDILTCYINGQKMDFIFDDLSESKKYAEDAGNSGMSCIVAGGTYNGDSCTHLTKTQCMAVKNANLKTCPGCKQIYWNEKTSVCELPSSAFEHGLNTGIKVGGMVAGMAVGTVIIVATGGTTGALAIAALTLDAAGTAIVVGAEIAMSDDAVKFLERSQLCKSAACAEQYLGDDIQHVINEQNHFQPAELTAIDNEIVRLVELLPADSEALTGNMASRQLSFWDADSWTPGQVWQAVGYGLQIAALAISIWDSVATKFPKATEAMERRITPVDKNVARYQQHVANGATSKADDLAKWQSQQAILDRTANSGLVVDDLARGATQPAGVSAQTADDWAEIMADGNKTLRRSAKQVLTPTKTAQQIADDGASLKKYDQLLATQAKRKLNTSEAQELNRIRNAWGHPTDDVVDAARGIQQTAATRAQLAADQAQLAARKAAIQKRGGQMSKADMADIAALEKRIAKALEQL